MTKIWENALESYRSQHFQVFTREQLFHASIDILLNGLDASPATILFFKNLSQPHVTPWKALITSVQSFYEGVIEFVPLKQLLENATHVAILYGEHFAWKSPDKWSYLFEVMHGDGGNARNYIIAHPPASKEQVRQAESVLKMPLAPSYVKLLHMTNGLGLALYETQFICGVGNGRAVWENKATFQLGAFHRDLYHEIASYWFQWHDTLAYERRTELDEGINTFRSDEQICVPFAYTVDDWCFDRSHQAKNGEYPILFWDHELREATHEYSDFEMWFQDIVINKG